MRTTFAMILLMANVLSSCVSRGTTPKQSESTLRRTSYVSSVWLKHFRRENTEGFLGALILQQKDHGYEHLEHQTPAVSLNQGKVFFGLSDGVVRGVTLGGQPLWSLERMGTISSIALDETSRQLAFTSSDGFLYLVDMDGHIIWRTEHGGGGTRPPVFTEGLLIASGVFGTVGAYARDNGEALWRYTREVSHEIHTNLEANVLLSDGSVYAGFSTGEIIQITSKDGQVIWKQDLSRELALGEHFPDIDALWMDTNKSLLVVAGSHGIYGLDPANGTQLWVKEIMTHGITPFQDKLILSEPKSIAMFDPKTQTTLWRKPMIFGSPTEVAVTAHRISYAETKGGIVVLDAYGYEHGRLMGGFRFNAKPALSASLGYAVTNSGSIVCFRH